MIKTRGKPVSNSVKIPFMKFKNQVKTFLSLNLDLFLGNTHSNGYD